MLKREWHARVRALHADKLAYKVFAFFVIAQFAIWIGSRLAQSAGTGDHHSKCIAACGSAKPTLSADGEYCYCWFGQTGSDLTTYSPESGGCYQFNYNSHTFAPIDKSQPHQFADQFCRKTFDDNYGFAAGGLGDDGRKAITPTSRTGSADSDVEKNAAALTAAGGTGKPAGSTDANASPGAYPPSPTGGASASNGGATGASGGAAPSADDAAVTAYLADKNNPRLQNNGNLSLLTKDDVAPPKGAGDDGKGAVQPPSRSDLPPGTASDGVGEVSPFARNMKSDLDKMSRLDPQGNQGRGGQGQQGGVVDATPSQQDSNESANLSSSDACRATAFAALAKDVGAKHANRDEAVAAMSAKQADYLKKYGCSADEGNLRSANEWTQITNIGLTAAAGASAGAAAANVQNAAAANPNDPMAVQKAALHNMASAQGITGSAQVLGGINQWIQGKRMGSIESDQDAAAKKGREAMDARNVHVAGNGGDYSAAGLGYSAANGEDGERVRTANTAGQSALAESVNKHETLSKQANASKWRTYMQAGINLVSGGLNIYSAWNYKDQAKKLDDKGPNAIVANGPGALVEDSTPPPNFNPTLSGSDSSAATADNSTDGPALSPMAVPPPLGGGGSPTGGLAGAPPPASSGMVNPSTMSGGGGGGGFGGGSGGGAAGAGDPQDQKGGDSISSGPSKYEAALTGGGAAGFGAAGAGGKPKDTNMGPDGLLAGLQGLLKPGEQGNAGPQNGLLDYTGARGRGPAAADDGSILGANDPKANLFLRNSNVTMANFKKGNLK
jgi:hypothetical protein